MKVRLCGTLAISVCALALAGCGAGDSATTAGGERIGFEQLAASATSSAEATSGRFSFAVTLGLPGADEPFALSGEGAFDTVNDRASFDVDMSSLAKLLGGFVGGFPGADKSDLPDFDDPGAWQLEIVQDGDVGYVRLPAIDDQLPDGKTWVRGTAADVEAGGLDFTELDAFTRNDPSDVLEALHGVSGEIETVGADELRGVEATHYRARLDAAALAERASTNDADAASLLDRLSGQSGTSDVPLDVWIDGSGLVRKVLLDVVVPDATSGQSSSVSLSFELWDYGEPVVIDVPPASQVADASALGG